MSHRHPYVSVIAAGVLALAGRAPLQADHVTDLDAGVYVQKSGSALSVDRHSAPTVADWNNDGKKDLIVGEFPGYAWLFLNAGTDTAPQFVIGSKLSAGGSAIRASYG